MNLRATAFDATLGLDCLAIPAAYIVSVSANDLAAPQWFAAGDVVFPAMLAAVESAVERVSLESYIFSPGNLSLRFAGALQAAAARGVKVRVLVDGLGSMELPDSFWEPLRQAGVGVKQFNPLSFGRLGIRNHRKLLVCDGRVAFIGGFNIADEYEGDGVTRGWRDVGVRVGGALATKLEASFDRLFALADFKQKLFVRLRHTGAKKALISPAEQLLLSGPGRGASPLCRSLRRDLKRAARAVRENGQAPLVRIVVAYFLPTWRLRRDLQRVARLGGRVQLILPAKCDVALSHLAARSLYQRMLRAGIELYEYQPQVLHAKLFIVNDAVYVGSANLDPRSLLLNYELMTRFESASTLELAGKLFDELLRHSQRIERAEWRKARTWWAKLKERFASFLLSRVDPYLSLRQWRSLPE